jgi:hypothetical protein
MAGLAFNDTSGGQGLIQDCEDRLNLGATAISGNTALLKTFTRYINQRYHQVVTMILDSQDDWDFDDSNNTDYAIATTPLVTSQRDYTFPTSLKILKIKRVDVTYNGSTYYKCEPFDSSMTGIGLGNDTNTDGEFSKTEPFYDIKTNSIWLYPLSSAADVTAGAKLRIEFYRDIVEFTTASTTAIPGFDTPFHQMLSIGASLDYAIIRNLDAKNDLAALWIDLEKRLRMYYGKKNDDINPQLQAAYINYE